jgi:acyl-CoA synthetase (AMP-forming)/AMP-acid ligase II
MGNRPEAVASILGTGLVGAVVVPLSTFSTVTELRDLLARADVVGVLTQRRLLDRDLADEIRSLDLDGWVGAVGEDSWDAFSVPSDGWPDGPVVEPSDEGLVLFSSGTTSAPKGVVHRHEAPRLQFWIQARVFRRTTASRVWAPLPLFWTAGLTTAMGPTLASGGCFVLQEVFDAGDALGLLERERVTEPYTLPHQANALAEHPDWDSTDLSSLREVYGKSVFTRHPSVDGDTSWTMPIGYGMSETCASVVSHRWDTSREEMKASTGRLLPGARLRIVDPDTGEQLGVDQDGEIALDGPTALECYVGKTRAESRGPDGFLRTGDVGYVDAAGEVHWTGRRTELIKTAGANVSPAELEIQLRACPDVRRARVVGLPDDRLGEIVTLCVEPAEGSAATADDLRAFLRERVAAYKVPRQVVFFGPGELPTTGGDAKVRDDELIRIATERLSTNGSTT